MKKDSKEVSDSARREAIASLHLIVRAVPAAHRRLAASHIQKVQRALGDSTPVEMIGKVPPRAKSRLSPAEIEEALDEASRS